MTGNLRYPGQYYDQETGFFYNGARYYDPETGRYVTSDPVGLMGGINTYAYGLDNPLGYMDPLGMAALGAIGDWFMGSGGAIFTYGAVTGDPFVMGGGLVFGAIGRALTFWDFLDETHNAQNFGNQLEQKQQEIDRELNQISSPQSPQCPTNQGQP